MDCHDGVSCDNCKKNNFNGKRYKCLICYDFDLCETCNSLRTSSDRHSAEHPMQCILTRSLYELYYGQILVNEQIHSYTCPFCGKLGFTDAGLYEHANKEHVDSFLEVVCPICATMVGGDPNCITDDFVNHYMLEHLQNSTRELISFLGDPSTRQNTSSSQNTQQSQSASGSNTVAVAVGSGTNSSSGSSLALNARPSLRRMNRGTCRGRRNPNLMQYISPVSIPFYNMSRDNVVDPIAELLSQISGARRSLSSSGGSGSGSSNNAIVPSSSSSARAVAVVAAAAAAASANASSSSHGSSQNASAVAALASSRLIKRLPSLSGFSSSSGGSGGSGSGNSGSNSSSNAAALRDFWENNSLYTNRLNLQLSMDAANAAAASHLSTTKQSSSSSSSSTAAAATAAAGATATGTAANQEKSLIPGRIDHLRQERYLLTEIGERHFSKMISSDQFNDQISNFMATLFLSIRD